MCTNACTSSSARKHTLSFTYVVQHMFHLLGFFFVFFIIFSLNIFFVLGQVASLCISVIGGHGGWRCGATSSHSHTHRSLQMLVYILHTEGICTKSLKAHAIHIALTLTTVMCNRGVTHTPVYAYTATHARCYPPYTTLSCRCACYCVFAY